MLKRLYGHSIAVSGGRWGLPLLGIIAFSEAIFNPIPPDIFVLSIVLAARDKWKQVVFVCTVCSVAGGIVGYGLGAWALESAQQWIATMHWESKFETATQFYRDWDIWAVFLAGFTPIPYKVFTIAAGMSGVSIWTFLVGSIVSRGARYTIIAGVTYRMGEGANDWINTNFTKLTWLVGLIVAIVGAISYFVRHA